MALSEWGWRYQATANFYLAPTRAWELFAGSIAAFIVHYRGIQANNGLSLLGLAAILFAIFGFDESTPFPSVYALVPVVGVVLLILFAESNTFVARILSAKIFVGIGLISYSAYLWHQPIFSFTRIYLKQVDLPFYIAVSLVFISFFIAILSWRYIEYPFRNKKFLSSSKIFMTSFCSLVIVGGIGLLTMKVGDNFERLLALQLSTSDYVYFGNLDERKFTEDRLYYSLREAKSLVMGSSRVMQISSKMLNGSSINLSVSGASVEDYVAFVGEAVAKLKPQRVFLGADPWLFNKFDGQDRWKSSELLFHHWDRIIKNGEVTSLAPSPLENKYSKYTSLNWAEKLYSTVSLRGGALPIDGSIEDVGKKAYDGAYIYNLEHTMRGQKQIEREFDQILNYSIKSYVHDDVAEARYIDLIKWLKLNHIEVKLILSPYHPKLFERIKTEKPIFLSIEEDYRKLAKELNIEVLGSYDPRNVNCEISEFFDGMHPKNSCVKKIF